MGLLDFWNNRRPLGELDSLRAQAYDSTTAALPPTRGNRPIIGNGPNTLRRLQQVAKQRSNSQLSDISAPIPSTSRISIGTASPRPSTSAGRSKSVPRSADIARAKSPLSPKKTKKYGPYRIYKDDDAPPTPGLPDQYSRRPSVDSSGSRNRSNHVDLLDAQSDLKPSDFYTRVRAAGTRDYGEDVADRNLSAYKSSTVPDSASAEIPAVPWQSTSLVHQFKRVSVIPEDANEGREQEDVAGTREESRTPSNHERQADPERPFGELSAHNSSRTRAPRPLSLHAAVSNFAYSPTEIPKPEARQIIADDEDEEVSRPAAFASLSERKNESQRTRPKSQVSTAAVGGRNERSHGSAGGQSDYARQTDDKIEYDSTEDGEPNLSAPSPRVSRRNDTTAPDPPRVNQGWKRTHGPTYRELTSSSRPNSQYGGGGNGVQLLPSTKPSSKSRTNVQPVPGRSSSLTPWPPAPESLTTIPPFQSGRALSPIQSHSVAAASVDERERYNPQAQSNPGREKGSRPRQRDLTMGSSYTAIPEERRYSSHSRHHSAKSNRSRRDTLESQTLTSDEPPATDGSDVEAKVARKTARRRWEDSSLHGHEEDMLWREENGFADVGKSLPGLFDGLSSPTISNRSGGPETPRLPATETLGAFLASRQHKGSSATASRAYNARIAKALIEHYAEDYDSDLTSDLEFDDEEETSRDKALKLLGAMKDQGLNVMDLLDMEENLKERERQDARMAMNRRKERKKVEVQERNSQSREGLAGGEHGSRAKRSQRPTQMETRPRMIISEY